MKLYLINNRVFVTLDENNESYLVYVCQKTEMDRMNQDELDSAVRQALYIARQPDWAKQCTGRPN